MVRRLDRLARSLSHLIKTVEDLQERGVGLRSLTDPVDTTTPQGVPMFHIFGAMAKLGRSLIRERTRAALEAARSRGRKAEIVRKVQKGDPLRKASAQSCVDHFCDVLTIDWDEDDGPVGRCQGLHPRT